MRKPRKPLTPISALHVFKLCFRSALLVAATVIYIVNRVRDSARPFGSVTEKMWLLGIIGLVFTVEMIFRFFPSRLESMGCQKQFRKNFVPTDIPYPEKSTWRTTLTVALVWLLLNGAIAALFFLGLIDEGILVLLSLFYSVCDMICILFFCPFQTWIMKNKCCGSCRIYNWDYAMMFTPLVLVVHPITYTVLAVALLLLAVWEIQVLRHRERFSTACNAALACRRCPEKLCQHKRQLRRFLRKHRELLAERGADLLERGSAVLEGAKARLSRRQRTGDVPTDAATEQEARDADSDAPTDGR